MRDCWMVEAGADRPHSQDRYRGACHPDASGAAEDVILMRAERAEDLLFSFVWANGVTHEQVLRSSSLALGEASG